MEAVDTNGYDGNLRPFNGAVVEGLEPMEVVIGKGQEEYIPLRALKSPLGHGQVLSRWRPTEEQRKAVASGADIFLSLMTFGGPLQPVQMIVARNLDAASVVEALQLAPPVEIET